MKYSFINLIILIFALGYSGLAQVPAIEAEGSIQLVPIKLFNEGAEAGMILFHGSQGVFRGYNGYKWVSLSINAHTDLNNCPNPAGDTEVPRPRCLTSMSVSLGEGGSTVIFAEEYDLGTTDNCGDYDISFSPTELMPTMTLTCDDRGTKPITLYITDTAGNSNLCDVLVVVQDMTGQCPPLP